MKTMKNLALLAMVTLLAVPMTSSLEAAPKKGQKAAVKGKKAQQKGQKAAVKGKKAQPTCMQKAQKLPNKTKAQKAKRNAAIAKCRAAATKKRAPQQAANQAADQAANQAADEALIAQEKQKRLEDLMRDKKSSDQAILFKDLLIVKEGRLNALQDVYNSIDQAVNSPELGLDYDDAVKSNMELEIRRKAFKKNNLNLVNTLINDIKQLHADLKTTPTKTTFDW
jgi:hypothetical protein